MVSQDFLVKAVFQDRMGKVEFLDFLVIVAFLVILEVVFLAIQDSQVSALLVLAVLLGFLAIAELTEHQVFQVKAATQVFLEVE